VVLVVSFLSLFSGKMLGDGYINQNPGRQPRFAFIHTSDDIGYARHCLKLFAPYIPFGKKALKEYSYLDPRTKKIYSRVHCQSLSSAIITVQLKHWYKERKIIPKELVAEHLDAAGLALWFQDDGSLKSIDRIILSVENFSPFERNFLQNLLSQKFRVASTLDKQNRIDISSRLETRKFQALVKPNLHPSMARKNTANQWKHWQDLWKQNSLPLPGVSRTTIYVHQDIHNAVHGNGFSKQVNQILDHWLPHTWQLHILDPKRRYQWLTSLPEIPSGCYPLGPRLRPNIKTRLIMAQATGLTRSELITLAIIEGQV
jgi:hypothetical protein